MECMNQKTYFAIVNWSTQKPGGEPLSYAPLATFGDLAAIKDFAGGAAVQTFS